MTQEEKQYYVKEATCPVCRKKFNATLVRSISLRPKINHSDFHVEYYGASPSHYVVQVCPNCLFASYRPDFNKIFGPTQTIFFEDEENRKQLFGTYNFDGVRDSATIQASYELALHCYQLRRKSRVGLLASLYLHMAWLAREEHRVVQEQQYMEEALRLYNEAFATDRSETPKDEIRQTYLIGDLSLRLGRLEESIAWFQKALKHSAINEYPGLARRVRDQWSEVRERANLH